MKKNIVVITGLLVIILAVGAIFHGLYVRIFTSHTGQEATEVTNKEFSRSPIQEEHPPPSMSRRDRDIETLAQQVSILAQNMKTLQNQFQVLLARINTEGTEKSRQEIPVSEVEQENRRHENSAEQPSMRFINEIRDDQWASSVEATIVTEFSTNPDVAGVTIDTIDCRESLCRLVWQYNPDITNEEAFATENEMLTAMNYAGFNASSQASLGGGLSEGFFWYNPPPQELRHGEGVHPGTLGGNSDR